MLRARFARLAIFRPAPLRKRFWQGGIALATLVLSIAAMNNFVSHDKSLTPKMLGNDFLPFYMAGQFVRDGRAESLYDLPTVKAAQFAIAAKAGLEQKFGPFWNPPFYAWAFVPFAGMPYREALLYWVLLNVAAVLCATLLLRRMFPTDADWRTTTLLPLLLLVSMPFIQAISHGQNTFISLLLVAMTATAWRERRALSAGIACGLLLYKPQLAVVLAIVMSLDLGWRAALAMAFTASCLLLITGFTLPGSIGDYLDKLPLNLHFMQVENTYLWERHVTFKGFWRLLLQGRAAGEATFAVTALTAGCAAVVGLALVRAVIRSKQRGIDDPFTGETSQRRRDRLIAATIAATPLLMPFYFDYDLLLLAVPATLLAVEITGRPVGQMLDRAERWLIGAWSILFLWMMINPGMAALTRVNVTVVLLTTVAALLVHRASRRQQSIVEAVLDHDTLGVTAHRLAA
ncbi:MAG: DUF2029 domain-containing protein [Anaerolineae bacterium]|nr:DUF2029 domain-containing protein [Phycisphaerae bacterium]